MVMTSSRLGLGPAPGPTPRVRRGALVALPAKMAIFATLLFGACTSETQTTPLRTASEQLLITTASERAAEKLDIQIPVGMKVFIDSSYFDGSYSRHALGAIRANFMKRGAALVTSRDQAAAVIEVRAGALALDESETLFGLRSFVLPIPFAGDFTTPELAFFKKSERKGVAKFAAAGYRLSDGRLIGVSEPDISYATDAYWIVMLVFSWKTSDREEVDEFDFLDAW